MSHQAPPTRSLAAGTATSLLWRRGHLLDTAGPLQAAQRQSHTKPPDMQRLPDERPPPGRATPACAALSLDSPAPNKEGFRSTTMGSTSQCRSFAWISRGKRPMTSGRIRQPAPTSEGFPRALSDLSRAATRRRNVLRWQAFSLANMRLRPHAPALVRKTTRPLRRGASATIGRGGGGGAEVAMAEGGRAEGPRWSSASAGWPAGI